VKIEDENHSKIFKRGTLDMEIDMRIVVVLLPLVAAGGWALFNIGQAALKQFQTFNSK